MILFLGSGVLEGECDTAFVLNGSIVQSSVQRACHDFMSCVGVLIFSSIIVDMLFVAVMPNASHRGQLTTW